MNTIYLNFVKFPSVIDFTNELVEPDQIHFNDICFFEYKLGHFASKDVLFKANRNSNFTNKGDLLIPYLNEYYLDVLILALERNGIVKNRFQHDIKWYLPSLKDVEYYPKIFNVKSIRRKPLKNTQYWLLEAARDNSFFFVNETGKLNSIGHHAILLHGCVPCFHIFNISPLRKINQLVGDNWKW